MLTSRDFVPWRFSDAGRRSAWMVSSSRRPKTCTLPDSCTAKERVAETFTLHQEWTVARVAFGSFDSRTDIDLGCAVGIAGKAHLVTAQFSESAQPPRADF